MLVLFNKQTKYIEHTSLHKIEVWKLRKEYLSSNGLQFQPIPTKQKHLSPHSNIYAPKPPTCYAEVNTRRTTAKLISLEITKP